MSKKTETKKSIFQKFLDFVEVAGNKLPTPVTLFVWLALVVIILSAIFAKMGVAVTYEGIKDGKIVEQQAAVVSL